MVLCLIQFWFTKAVVHLGLFSYLSRNGHYPHRNLSVQTCDVVTWLSVRLDWFSPITGSFLSCGRLGHDSALARVFLHAQHFIYPCEQYFRYVFLSFTSMSCCYTVQYRVTDGRSCVSEPQTSDDEPPVHSRHTRSRVSIWKSAAVSSSLSEVY